MADLAFSWLEDVDKSVRTKIQQPRSQSGQPTWSEDEFQQGYSKAYEDLYREIQIMDRNYNSTFLDVTVPAGTTEYALPARTSFLRGAAVMYSNGQRRWPIGMATWEDDGEYRSSEFALLRPDRNSLTFTVPTVQSVPVRLYYGSYYIPILHGCAQGGGGSDIILASYCSVEDDLYNGLVIKIVEGPGLGEEGTILDYNGSTKVATMTAPWVTMPTSASRYTSRPDLPWYAKDVFENYSISCLYEKQDETLSSKFMQLAQVKLQKLWAAIHEQQRQEPQNTYDQGLNGAWGDPGECF